jgi:biotin carboxyl carrier protein
VLIAPGDIVRPGQSLLILEAMKMQNHIIAHDHTVVQALHVAPGDTVTKGQLLVAFEPQPCTASIAINVALNPDPS